MKYEEAHITGANFDRLLLMSSEEYAVVQACQPATGATHDCRHMPGVAVPWDQQTGPICV